MNRKRSLRQILARQWAVFALVLFVSFAAMAVLLLYLLEDRFIDRRLQDIGDDVIVSAAPPALPPRFELMGRAAVAGTMRERTRGQRTGVIREFRLPDGRYVHVLAGRDRQGADFLLAYDVSDQLAVNAALVRGWPWLLLIAAVLAACAWSLASRFVARVSRQALGLVIQVGQAEGPGRLRVLAENESILEFSELARLNADAWEARLATLGRERETLAFLGHELRTPLQSARTSLALLQDDHGNVVAWQRLRRAVDRLARASHAILWLSREDEPTAENGCAIDSMLDALAREFEPLAALRQQTIRQRSEAGARWPLPPEVAETVVANLLLNAIQHGAPGDIDIVAQSTSLCIGNGWAGLSGTDGFGLGLQVARRLLARFGWQLSEHASAERIQFVMSPLTATPDRLGR